MGRFVHVGGLARAGAHRWRACLAVLAGLVLLAVAGCSTGPVWMGADSGIGVGRARIAGRGQPGRGQRGRDHRAGRRW